MSRLIAALGRAVGVRGLSRVDRVEPSFAASWATAHPVWLVAGTFGLVALTVAITRRSREGRARGFLVVCRACWLILLLVTLAEPSMTLTANREVRPAFWLLFDGSESMAVEENATVDASGSARAPRRPRIEIVRELLRARDGNLVARLGDRFRLGAFLFDGTEGARALELKRDTNGALDARALADQLTASGTVTALGAAVDDLARRREGEHLAGVLVVSDFHQNAGLPLLDAARRLGRPIHTLGVGSTTPVNLSVALQVPLALKRGERGSATVTLRQSGLDRQAVSLRLSAIDRDGTSIALAQRTVTPRDPLQLEEFPIVLEQAGPWQIVAEADPLDGEVEKRDNRDQRRVVVRDEGLRVLLVEDEPSWEWRALKSILENDPSVGPRGFRTYLRAADASVATTNTAFLPSLEIDRRAFFAEDVIILGDVSASMLPPSFCAQAVELVRDFGAGLVVLGGPRHGPAALAGTPLIDLLPATPAPGGPAIVGGPFRPRFTPQAKLHDFLRLGADDAGSAAAWASLGPLDWYRPSARVDPLTTVLAEHPTDLCLDGKTPQPLITLRRFGRGEVIAFALNETWRLRRQSGERFQRQLWVQMVHRLGLGTAIGDQKRFVARLDLPSYRPDDQVTLAVEAYDADYRPMTEDTLPDHALAAVLEAPGSDGRDATEVPFKVSQRRPGFFEATVSLARSGPHKIRVTDPVTRSETVLEFPVEALSAERRSAARDLVAERELARQTGGTCYTPETIGKLPGDVDASPRIETRVEVVPLWSTWLWFATILALMLCEWLTRRLLSLP
jgi:hypothetical protein